MVRSFINIALRCLLREKGNTIINVLGLALGIGGSLVLFLIVQNGTSYDAYHTKQERIYRLVTKGKGNTGDSFTQGIPTPLPEAFANDFKEVEETVFTSYRRNNLISVVDSDGSLKKYEESKGVVFTQPAFFKIFDRQILRGSPQGLSLPNHALISRKWALKYFGTEDAIERIIAYDNIDYKIIAVMEDYPLNTDLPFDLVLSYVTGKKTMEDSGWDNISDADNCYFLIKAGSNVNTIEAQMPSFVKKYLGENELNNGKTFIVQPLRDLHSDMRFGNYNSKMPRAALVIFIVIAVFLLATSCFNFINLATADAIKRARQVGIRKVLGSSRSQLIVQFLSESFLITLVAIPFSLIVAQGLLEFINPLLELSLTLGLGSQLGIWKYLGTIVIIVTIAAGMYPAAVISGFNPALALKNQLNNKSSGSNKMRKGLVVIQFFISQFFIIGTLVMTRQLEYLQQQDLGFETQAIATVPIPVKDTSHIKMHTLKNEILQLKGVEKVSLCYAPPSFKAVLSSNFNIVGKDDEYSTQVKQVDGDYIALYNIEVIAGEKLADTDTMNAVLVNEKLVKMTGLTNHEIIGRELSFWGKRLPVKGILKDFNTTSLERPIEPVVLINNVNGYQSISIKLNPLNMQEILKQVQDKWEAAYPEFIFKYDFIDDQVRQLYKGERKLTDLLNVFSSIAIFIGCLGLYGLVAFMANQKTKEVGVRKVLGASVESIVFLFSKEIVKLILISFGLAAPIAGFIMDKLLQQFAYKIEMGPIIFLMGLGFTFFIAFLTVGFRSIKAAMANPIASLRSE